MEALLHTKEAYFMDDPREGERLEKKVNASLFVDRYLKDHLDDFPNGIILEAGCGPGAFINIIARNYTGCSVTGIDISEDRVAQANQKLGDLNNAKAIKANIYDLPFPNDYFDFIYSRFLFEYLQEPVAAAKELYRVCKPGGKLLLQDLDGQFTFYPDAIPELADVLMVLKHQTGFDPDVGRKLFSFGKAAGFSFIDIEAELYHKVFGKIDDFNFHLWNLKLDIAAKYLKRLLNDKKAEELRAYILDALQNEDTVIFSHLFTVNFMKKVQPFM
jgi:SAM-dependent methyltransferase